MASLKGGYDYDFIHPPPKSLECSICLLTLRDPHVISCCGNHFCHSCINRILRDNKPCPLCNEPGFTIFLHKGVAREVNALKVYCPQKQLGCDWEGELGQVAQHLNPGVESRERGCGFVMVECVNKCGEWFQRQMVHKHETEDCPRRPVEVQLAFVMNRLNALAAENKAIKEKNEAEVLALKAENTSLKRQLETSLKQLEIQSSPVPVPPFYFTLHNYNHYKKSNCQVISPPFYSHPGGYKMELEVYPNGRDTTKNSFFSVYIRVLRGEYDDKLQWPFRGEVSVEMHNWTLRKWVQITYIRFDKNSPGECTKRVVERRGNASFGYPDLIRLDQLTKYYVNKDDDFVSFRIPNVQHINIS